MVGITNLRFVRIYYTLPRKLKKYIIFAYKYSDLVYESNYVSYLPQVPGGDVKSHCLRNIKIRYYIQIIT